MKDFLTNLDYEEVFDNYIDFAQYVVTNVLDNLEDNPHYLEQVVNFGLQSGICPQLIYHRDCKQVFDEYEEDIFEIYNEVRFDIKDSLYINIDTLVWISYEFICSLLLEQYEYQKEYNEEC